jgi:hypothetical protein
MPKKNYDFSGIATAYEVLCDDGRVIRDNAFGHQEGETVPIVWRHRHDDITNILGQILLTRNEGSPLGVRGNARFANTKEGHQAKELVHDGTIDGLSIWANEIQEEVGRFELAPGVFAQRSVTSGVIREVSLVPKGMNPGARIDEVIRHSTDPLDPDTWIRDGLIIHSGIPIEIDMEDEEEEEVEEEQTESSEAVEDETAETEGETESDEDETISHEDETFADVLATLTEKQREVVDIVLHSALTGDTLPVSENEDDEDGEDLGAIFDTLNDKQRDVVQYLAGTLAESGDEAEEPEEEEPEESISQGDLDMPKTYNPFENAGQERDPLAHENVMKILQSAKTHRAHSLREEFSKEEVGDSVIQHSVTDIDFMFPDARAVQPGGPQYFADRDMSWVRVVLNGVRPRPFSRIKSWYADISGADARAKGYVTGNQKVEEVIAVLKRTTVPQTIYKFQKLDRDDVIDITDFNVVVWLKAEMRMMLEEELARAVLISDGRNDTGDDAILSANVRPIYNDADVYTHKSIYNDVGSEDDWVNFTDTEVLAFVDHVAQSLTYYRGAGGPTLFCQPALISKMLLVRDTTGRRIHDNLQALAAAMRVSKIVEIPVMAGLEATGVVDPTGTDQNGAAIPAGTYDIATLGVVVNLQDYVIGADNGGQTAFFDDFDLNFNKYEYLYETRVSGALVNPKSAIAIQLVTAKTA